MEQTLSNLQCLEQTFLNRKWVIYFLRINKFKEKNLKFKKIKMMAIFQTVKVNLKKSKKKNLSQKKESLIVFLEPLENRKLKMKRIKNKLEVFYLMIQEKTKKWKTVVKMKIDFKNKLNKLNLSKCSKTNLKHQLKHLWAIHMQISSKTSRDLDLMMLFHIRSIKLKSLTNITDSII